MLQGARQENDEIISSDLFKTATGWRNGRVSRWGLIKKTLSFLAGAYLFVSLKRPFREYSIRLANNAELKDIFRFRYKIYCLTDKLLNADDYPDHQEKDEYDNVSFQFAVLGQGGEVVGTFRLIQGSKNSFPTEKEFQLNIKKEKKANMVEISRLMVEKKYRKTMLLLDIMRAIYQFSIKNGVEHWLGCAEPWFIKTMDAILGPFDVIEKPKFCFNAVNYPFILNVWEIEKNVERKSRLLRYFFSYPSKNIRVDPH